MLLASGSLCSLLLSDCSQQMSVLVSPWGKKKGYTMSCPWRVSALPLFLCFPGREPGSPESFSPPPQFAACVASRPVVTCLLCLWPSPGLYTIFPLPPFSSHWDRSIFSSMNFSHWIPHLVLDVFCVPVHIQMAHLPDSYFPSSSLGLAPGPSIPF